MSVWCQCECQCVCLSECLSGLFSSQKATPRETQQKGIKIYPGLSNHCHIHLSIHLRKHVLSTYTECIQQKFPPEHQKRAWTTSPALQWALHKHHKNVSSDMSDNIAIQTQQDMLVVCWIIPAAKPQEHMEASMEAKLEAIVEAVVEAMLAKQWSAMILSSILSMILVSVSVSFLVSFFYSFASCLEKQWQGAVQATYHQLPAWESAWARVTQWLRSWLRLQYGISSGISSRWIVW